MQLGYGQLHHYCKKPVKTRLLVYVYLHFGSQVY